MFTEARQWMCEWLSCVSEQVRWGVRRTHLPGEMFTARASKWQHWKARNGHCMFPLQLIHLHKKSRKHNMKGFYNIREPQESQSGAPASIRDETWERPKWEAWRIKQWQNTKISLPFWLTAGAASEFGAGIISHANYGGLEMEEGLRFHLVTDSIVSMFTWTAIIPY